MTHVHKAWMTIRLSVMAPGIWACYINNELQLITFRPVQM